MYFNDQWPSWYQMFPRMDDDPAPISGLPKMMHYAKIAFNGMNLMQIFAANSILARKVGPEAEIIMMTIPFKTHPFEADSFPLIVVAFMSFFLLIMMIPLIYYTAYGIAQGKEGGFQLRLFSDGLGYGSYWFSWLFHFMILNALISAVYVFGLKWALFKRDHIGMIYLVTFMGVQSLFFFIWAISKLTSSTKMALVFNTFFIFLTFYLSSAVD